MIERVYTGNYEECKVGNLISISGDRGKDAGFEGKCIPELAPKKDFFRVYKDNIGKVPEEENARYYIGEYYRKVLSKVNIEELLEGEKNPILLCYEKGQAFCHRHVVAEYIELMYGIPVREVAIDNDLNIEEGTRPAYIGEMLIDVMEQEKNLNEESEEKAGTAEEQEGR